MSKEFVYTRVVTKDVLTDSFQSIRNFFGLRLRSYEKMIDQNSLELISIMKSEHKKIKWYRLSINPLISGSVMITLYGEAI